MTKPESEYGQKLRAHIETVLREKQLNPMQQKFFDDLLETDLGKLDDGQTNVLHTVLSRLESRGSQ